MQLSEHFSLSEFEYSATAIANNIDNRVPSTLIPNLINLCEQVLEPLREHIGEPIIISSGYRCHKLNELVGGVPNSQHLTGEAADIYHPDVRKLKYWFIWIQDNCRYDQLLLEKSGSKTWIHVSCRFDYAQNRQRVICLIKR